MRSTRPMPSRWYENLITPKHTASSSAFARVPSSLANHRFQNRQILRRAVHIHQTRQLYARLIIILRPRQRRQSRALPSGVIHPNRPTTREQCVQVNTLARILRFITRFRVRVQRPQPVTGAIPVPVFVHTHNHRRSFCRLTARVFQPRLPV